MSDCSKGCDTCDKSCKDRSMLVSPNVHSKIKKVVAVVSGKGGVGKSLVSGLTAAMIAKQGKNVAVLDADITGASIARMFGINNRAMASEEGIIPCTSKGGIKVISANMFLENDSDPVLWRGPIIASMVQKFWKEVVWGDVDYMFIDMPPGTGDVPLTVFQSIKVDGILVVTTPQDLVSMIAQKAVKMANMMNIPILGIVENMSYIQCTGCQEKIYLYGQSQINKVAQKYNLKVLANIPIVSQLAQSIDKGETELVEAEYMNELVKNILALEK